MDCVLTTREIGRMIKAEHINPTELEKRSLTTLRESGPGPGDFRSGRRGNEAALRSVYYLITGENPPVEAFSNVRGRNGWREATFYIKGDLSTLLWSAS